MKKILAMSLLTMTLTMCFGLTAFAAGSVDTSAPVVSQEVLNSHQAATTVDKVTTASGTEITFEVHASNPQIYKIATQVLNNVLAAPIAGQNYQVDASSPVVLVDIVASTQPDSSVNVTIKHSGIVSGKTYLVMHYNGAGWDKQIVTGGNGSLVASFSSFSPVAFVAIEKAPAASSPSYMDRFVDMLAARVDAAKSSGTPVVLTKQENISTLPISFMKKLLDANVALEMEYTYDGQDFAITIPAGKAIVDGNIPYYGPLFLAAYYGNHAGSAATADTYLVVSGDTLSKIANANKTTVAKLASLNPEIKDVNRIYPGQRIKLK